METQNIIQKLMTPPNLCRLKVYLRLIFLLAFFVILGLWLDYWLRGELGVTKRFASFANGQWGAGVLVGGGIIYILLLSLPFVPGVELGVLLMFVFGKAGIVFVYFATVAGLSLAFAMGRWIPEKWIASWREKIGLFQSADSCSDVIDKVMDNALIYPEFCRQRLGPYLKKYRYLALAILFNAPGNYLIGGGGGISVACGISRSISLKWFLFTVALAVSPVPLLAFFGVIELQAFLGIPK